MDEKSAISRLIEAEPIIELFIMIMFIGMAAMSIIGLILILLMLIFGPEVAGYG